MWLKFPDITMKAQGCCDWSSAVTEYMTSHDVVALANGGT